MDRDIKEIIYRNAKKGGLCEDLEDGQIIGLRTGKGLELDILSENIENYLQTKIERINLEKYILAIKDIKSIINDLKLTNDEYKENTTFSMTELQKGFDLCKKRLLDMIGNV